MNHVAPYWKALIGFVAPGAVIIGSAVTDSSVGGEMVTQGEWITAIVAAVVTAAGVYAKANHPVPDGTGVHRG